MKVIYGISRWTNACRSHARHIPGPEGKPLCGDKRRKIFTYETVDDEPTCLICRRKQGLAKKRGD